MLAVPSHNFLLYTCFQAAAVSVVGKGRGRRKSAPPKPKVPAKRRRRRRRIVEVDDSSDAIDSD